MAHFKKCGAFRKLENCATFGKLCCILKIVAHLENVAHLDECGAFRKLENCATFGKLCCILKIVAHLENCTAFDKVWRI